MDFRFTPEQDSLRKMIAKFGENEIVPKRAGWDLSGEFPWDLYKALGELGLLGLLIPDEYGGNESDMVTLAVALEELGRYDITASMLLTNTTLMGSLIASDAAETTKREWLPKIAAGDKCVGLGLTEPEAGADAGNLKMEARLEGDHYIINGEKNAVSMLSGADAVICFAKDSSANGKVSAFLVPCDLPGASKVIFDDMGCRPIGRGIFTCEDVKIPAEYLLGKPGKGFHMIMNRFDFTRAGIGLFCLAAAKQTIDETVTYAKQRVAFGQPIGKFQGVSLTLANHAAEIDAARWLCYRTFWLRDENEPHSAESAASKLLGVKLSIKAIEDCIAIVGHVAYTKELPIEQRLRDIIGFLLGDGPPQIQSLVVARELFGKDFRLS